MSVSIAAGQRVGLGEIFLSILQQFAMTLSTAAVTLPTHAAPRLACVTGDPDLSAAIDDLISQRNSAAIIGEAYLAQFDDERSADILLSKIHESLRADTQRIDKQTLLGRIRADFERSDIVNLHGWLLSRTEARLCALYSF